MKVFFYSGCFCLGRLRRIYLVDYLIYPQNILNNTDSFRLMENKYFCRKIHIMNLIMCVLFLKKLLAAWLV